MAAPPLLIEVRALAGASSGILVAAGRRFPCALGRAGIVAEKSEGDGGTPAGRFLLRQVLWRPDRGPPPATRLPVSAIDRDDGWCDDPADPLYNRRVRLPYAGNHETLWRDDHLYDALAIIGWNDEPPVPGRGSAIFLHLAREGAVGFAPTEGCVGLVESDLRVVLAGAGPGALIDIAVA